MKTKAINHKKRQSSFILSVLLSMQVAFSQALIIDHSCTDISVIPEEYIIKARAMVLIATGESHGRQLPIGFEELAKLDTLYRVKVADYAPPAGDSLLKVGRSLRTTSNWTWPTMSPYDFFDRIPGTITYCEQNNIQVNAFVHTFCWWNQPEGIEPVGDHLGASNYCNDLSAFEASYPDYHFIYSTGTCGNNPGEVAFHRQMANLYIRNYCIDSSKILFDFADIEACDSAGIMNYAVYNDTSYLMFNDEWEGNALLDVSHEDGGTGCHVNVEGAIQKAKAIWWLLACLAGWNGVPDATPENPAHDINMACYPNPFSGNIYVSVDLPGQTKVTIEIMDIYGKLVEKQNQGDLPGGHHTFGIEADGFPAGIYMCRIYAGAGIKVTKLLKIQPE